jgi:hypothetical protein
MLGGEGTISLLPDWVRLMVTQIVALTAQQGRVTLLVWGGSVDGAIDLAVFLAATLSTGMSLLEGALEVAMSALAGTTMIQSRMTISRNVVREQNLDLK